jgi:hypothetical protein
VDDIWLCESERNQQFSTYSICRGTLLYSTNQWADSQSNSTMTSPRQYPSHSVPPTPNSARSSTSTGRENGGSNSPNWRIKKETLQSPSRLAQGALTLPDLETSGGDTEIVFASTAPTPASNISQSLPSPRASQSTGLGLENMGEATVSAIPSWLPTESTHL